MASLFSSLLVVLKPAVFTPVLTRGEVLRWGAPSPKDLAHVLWVGPSAGRFLNAPQVIPSQAQPERRAQTSSWAGLPQSWQRGGGPVSGGEGHL